MTKTMAGKLPIVVPTLLNSGSPNQSVRTVLLDTSVQIERFKAARKSKPVEAALRDFRFKATSSYARFEFNRAWLRRLACVYEISKKAKSVHELFGLIDDKYGKHPAHVRWLTTCTQAAEAWLDKVPCPPGVGQDVMRARAHLRRWIFGAHEMWRQSITHEFNGTGCIRANAQPRKAPDGTLDVLGRVCSKKRPSCHIVAFFMANRSEFSTIAQAIKNEGVEASAELKAALDIIAAAEKDPTYLCSSSVCQKLGDILIAIDGLRMETYAAHNPREWPLIAKALGKQLLDPVSATPSS